MPDDPVPVPEGTRPAAAPKDLPKPRPKGEPDKVVQLRDLIEHKLVGMLGGYAADEHGNYILGVESARVWIVPAWLPNGASVVRVFAITNLDVVVSAELTSYLLAKNLEFVFGSFALDVAQGAVWFNHNLLGDFLNPEELEATIAAVAQTADRFDDEIKERFGGRLYVDSPDAKIEPPSAPGYL
jgi:hypothetical protein